MMKMHFLMQSEPLLISQGEVPCSGMRCVLLLWSSYADKRFST